MHHFTITSTRTTSRSSNRSRPNRRLYKRLVRQNKKSACSEDCMPQYIHVKATRRISSHTKSVCSPLPYLNLESCAQGKSRTSWVVCRCRIIQLNQLISTARLLTAPPLYTHYQQRLFEPLMTTPTRLSSLTFRNNCPIFTQMKLLSNLLSNT